MRLGDMIDREIERERLREAKRRERREIVRTALGLLAFAIAIVAALALLAWMAMVVLNAQDRLANRQARSFGGAVAMAARTPIW